MPNTREKQKLIELINEAEEWADHKCDELECETCPADKMKSNCVQQLMVDRLIANGVTIAKWIPVTERLPDNSVKYIVVADSKYHSDMRVVSAKSLMVEEFWGMPMGCFAHGQQVTHWMPLSEPPKGE